MVEEGKVEEPTVGEAPEEIAEKPEGEQESPETPTEEEPPKEQEEVAEAPSEEAPKPKPPSQKIVKPDRGESYWTPKELASKMACTQSYIYLMIKEGKIKAVKQGRLVKISPEEVQKVLTDGLPLPPKPEAKVEAEEIVVTDERILKKMEAPHEPTEEPEPEKGKPGWPLSIFFK